MQISMNKLKAALKHFYVSYRKYTNDKWWFMPPSFYSDRGQYMQTDIYHRISFCCKKCKYKTDIIDNFIQHMLHKHAVKIDSNTMSALINNLPEYHNPFSRKSIGIGKLDVIKYLKKNKII